MEEILERPTKNTTRIKKTTDPIARSFNQTAIKRMKMKNGTVKIIGFEKTPTKGDIQNKNSLRKGMIQNSENGSSNSDFENPDVD